MIFIELFLLFAVFAFYLLCYVCCLLLSLLICSVLGKPGWGYDGDMLYMGGLISVYVESNEEGKIILIYCLEVMIKDIIFMI